MTEKIKRLERENDALREELEYYRKMVRSYENVLKLNERELRNAEDIIKMYEKVVEFAGSEFMSVRDIAKAHENVSQLSRMELMDALKKIKELEEKNRNMKKREICQS